jgi:hypothetical protein
MQTKNAIPERWAKVPGILVIKADCFVLTHSRNRHPDSQFGLMPYLLIRVSPSDVETNMQASLLSFRRRPGLL